jgi:hypothetical protein
MIMRMSGFETAFFVRECLTVAACGPSVQYRPTVVANSAKQFRGN